MSSVNRKSRVHHRRRRAGSAPRWPVDCVPRVPNLVLTDLDDGQPWRSWPPCWVATRTCLTVGRRRPRLRGHGSPPTSQGRERFGGVDIVMANAGHRQLRVGARGRSGAFKTASSTLTWWGSSTPCGPRCRRSSSAAATCWSCRSLAAFVARPGWRRTTPSKPASNSSPTPAARGRSPRSRRRVRPHVVDRHSRWCKKRSPTLVAFNEMLARMPGPMKQDHVGGLSAARRWSRASKAARSRIYCPRVGRADPVAACRCCHAAQASGIREVHPGAAAQMDAEAAALGRSHQRPHRKDWRSDRGC